MKTKGIITSKGIAKGFAYRLNKQSVDSIDQPILAFEEAKAVLEQSTQKASAQLRSLIERAKGKVGEQEVRILEAHILLLEDPEYQQTIVEQLSSHTESVIQAIEKTRCFFEALFLGMEGIYMQERAADINDVSKRLMRCVLGIEEVLELPEGSIVFCEDLEPSDTVALDPMRTLGIVTEKGGETSHSAIIAKSLGIPALSKVKFAELDIQNGTPVIVDALEGCLILEPTSEDFERFEVRKMTFDREKSIYNVGCCEPAHTLEGQLMEISANIAGVSKMDETLTLGADGVGLFRTEFLYMNRDTPPTLMEQFDIYKIALVAFGPKPMVIRTFDIGGDKVISYLNLAPEMNPFLGYRAVRISLDRPDLFRIQVKALLMASVFGNLKVMIPMISAVEEIIQVRAVFDSVKQELIDENTPFQHVQLGMMVEIPAVAVQADKFAKYVDFFSIGTNDLLQYTVAVDRMNEKLTHLYSWYHPSLLAMIRMTAEAGKKAGIWVGICGEAAGDPLLLPVYVALGITELSMSQRKIPEIKWHLRQLKTDACKLLTEQVLALDTAEQVKTALEEAREVVGITQKRLNT
jgi:phosphotransferase system enzyme I (PtsI)